MEENSGMWLCLDGSVYREDISMVYEAVEGLVQYGLDKGLISEALWKIWVMHGILYAC